jgi:hypothetical protein
MLSLRDGSTTLDPRLDAIFDKDPGNLDYPVTALLPETVQHISVAHAAGPVTNQGKEGACVGHGVLGCLMCSPNFFAPPIPPDDYAYELYHDIQDKDDWTGCSKGASCPISPTSEVYHGTSLKAGGKVALERGLIKEFRWAFGLEECLAALTQGPVVLAVPWFESMYETSNGIVIIGGQQVGRHCILVPQVDFEAREVEWQNSWGLKYGKNGRARLSFGVLDLLLRAEGEVMVPVFLPKPAVTTHDHSVGMS